MLNIAHSQRAYVGWCPRCKLALLDYEIESATDTESVEFWGQRSSRRVTYVTCAACGSDLEDYKYQDDPS